MGVWANMFLTSHFDVKFFVQRTKSQNLLFPCPLKGRTQPTLAIDTTAQEIMHQAG
jgi:hypothetical protein